jgi:hypothetical protein
VQLNVRREKKLWNELVAMEEYPMSDLLILEFLRLRRPELNIVG